MANAGQIRRGVHHSIERLTRGLLCRPSGATMPPLSRAPAADASNARALPSPTILWHGNRRGQENGGS